MNVNPNFLVPWWASQNPLDQASSGPPHGGKIRLGKGWGGRGGAKRRKDAVVAQGSDSCPASKFHLCIQKPLTVRCLVLTSFLSGRTWRSTFDTVDWHGPGLALSDEYMKCTY